MAVVHFREQPTVAESVRFQISSPAGSSSPGGVSPDGRLLVFFAPGPDGRTLLWVRALDSLELRSLPGTAGVDRPFFWSPDSHVIAFGADGKLKKIEVSGGPAQTICDVDSTTGALGGDWNRDGVIIFGGDPAGIMRVSPAGGVPAPLTAARGTIHTFPSFLPDGRHFIYLRAPVDSGVFLGSLDATPEQQSSKRLLATQVSAVYARSIDPNRGYVLFLREGTLMAQPFDASRLELGGEAVPIAERVGHFLLSGFFSVSATGVLTYLGDRAELNVSRPTWFDRQGTALGPAGEPGPNMNLALSPDGTRMATSRRGAMFPDIWLVEFARDLSMQLTFGPGPVLAPVWSPDGSRIAFERTGDGLYTKAANSSGKEEFLLKFSGPLTPDDWSRDGRFLLYSAGDPKTGNDLWVLPLTGDRKSTPFLQTRSTNAPANSLQTAAGSRTCRTRPADSKSMHSRSRHLLVAAARY